MPQVQCTALQSMRELQRGIPDPEPVADPAAVWLRRLVQYFPAEIGNVDDMPEDLVQDYMRNTSMVLGALEVRWAAILEPASPSINRHRNVDAVCTQMYSRLDGCCLQANVFQTGRETTHISRVSIDEHSMHRMRPARSCCCSCAAAMPAAEDAHLVGPQPMRWSSGQSQEACDGTCFRNSALQAAYDALIEACARHRL